MNGTSEASNQEISKFVTKVEKFNLLLKDLFNVIIIFNELYYNTFP